MVKNKNLSTEDLNVISQNETEMYSIVSQLEKVRQFNTGDYLICIRVAKDTGQRVAITNSYGTHTKFKVVFIDKNGIPYVKEISSNGLTRGPIKSLMGSHEQDQWGNHGWNDFEFEHDPHFVEAIILSAEQGYDPTEVQRNKKKLRDEITEHNIKSKLKTSETADVVAAFATMQPGETYWFSTKNGMVIDKATIIPIPVGWKNHYGRKVGHITQVEVTLSNGKKQTYLPHEFRHRNLYKAMPRSYKELSDSI